MKIVQSFWTRPIFSSVEGTLNNRLCGGWIHQKFHLLSWAFSCHQLRKYYDEVELFTDQLGKEILIDKLGLPYTRVHLVLDELNMLNPQLWAIGKILTYSRQRDPFLHVDGDVYIWERFNKKIEGAALVSQNREIGFQFYDQLMDSLIENRFMIPECISRVRSIDGAVNAFNAGIVGGKDLEFFAKYTKEALSFAIDNAHLLDHIDAGMFNTVFEQHLFYCMAKMANITVQCYTDIRSMEKLDVYLKGLRRFKSAPKSTRYIHLFGEAKKDQPICDVLAEKMRVGYPEVFSRIIEIIQCEVV